jgi:DNA-binding response OmpR family regulator
MRVLIVEDYAPLRRSLCKGLREEGYAVDAVGDGREALEYFEAGDYDVVVLDLMLPGLDGFGVLRRIRSAAAPSRVLVLSARDALDDRVRGLDLGADDYLVKPFAFEELKARLRALVRRRYEAPPVVRIGDLEIDQAARVVRRGGRRIDLTAREYAILEALALRAGEIVSREAIWERIYDFSEERSSNVIDVYVGYLRRKLEAGGGSRVLRTHRGLGYSLEEPRS